MNDDKKNIEEDRERYLFLLTGESIIVRSLNLYYDSNKNNEKFFNAENFTPTDTVPNPLIELVNQLIEIKFEQKELIDRIENEKTL